MTRRLASRAAFTLIELMIVIAIIGVLAAIAVPSFQKARAHSQLRACYANQKVIVGALVQYNLDNNTSYKTNPIDWDEMLSQGYLRSRPHDPGGGNDSANNYQLHTTIPDLILCSEHGPIEEITQN